MSYFRIFVPMKSFCTVLFTALTIQKELQPYIKGFTAFCSSPTAFTTVCSYGDDLVLGTTWAFRSTEMLKNFYRRLSAEGLDITLYATEVDGE